MTDKKNESTKTSSLKFLIEIIQVILFIPIQIAFIPFIIIGMVDAVHKEFSVSKKLGVSFTAIQSLQYRWVMHYFETRQDKLSVEFVKHFPCESHFGLLATYGALIVCQKLFGFKTKFSKLDEKGKEKIFSTAGRRVLMFDEIVEKYLDEVDQIVIPGAGFDFIAQRYTKGKNVKVFEIDQISTQKVKIETMDKANIDHHWITYVPVDYSKESWADKLIAAGFDKTKKSLFIWQSVSMYLEPDVAKESLIKMTDLCAAGSIVAQDLYSQAFISGENFSAAKKTSDMFEKMGESWKFGVDMSDSPKKSVELFLNECGLKMTEFYLFGEKLSTEPYYCIAEAVK